MQLPKEEYARKRIYNGCLVQIESPVTQDNCDRHHSASMAMMNSYRRDRIFNPQLTAIKNSYNKKRVMFEHLLHTNMRQYLSILMLQTKM